MARSKYPFHLVAIVAAALVFGVAAHGVFQAIEHHDGLKDAAALCAAAVAIAAVVRLGGGNRRSAQLEVPRWIAEPSMPPAGADLRLFGRSAAWLQRFRN